MCITLPYCAIVVVHRVCRLLIAWITLLHCSSVTLVKSGMYAIGSRAGIHCARRMLHVANEIQKCARAVALVLRGIIE